MTQLDSITAETHETRPAVIVPTSATTSSALRAVRCGPVQQETKLQKLRIVTADHLRTQKHGRNCIIACTVKSQPISGEISRRDIITTGYFFVVARPLRTIEEEEEILISWVNTKQGTAEREIVVWERAIALKEIGLSDKNRSVIVEDVLDTIVMTEEFKNGDGALAGHHKRWIPTIRRVLIQEPEGVAYV